MAIQAIDEMTVSSLFVRRHPHYHRHHLHHRHNNHEGNTYNVHAYMNLILLDYPPAFKRESIYLIKPNLGLTRNHLGPVAGQYPFHNKNDNHDPMLKQDIKLSLKYLLCCKLQTWKLVDRKYARQVATAPLQRHMRISACYQRRLSDLRREPMGCVA